MKISIGINFELEMDIENPDAMTDAEARDLLTKAFELALREHGLVDKFKAFVCQAHATNTYENTNPQRN